MVKNGIYKHHKGKLYKVIGMVRHSETVEELVLYHQMYDSERFSREQLWVRPRAMFEEVLVKEGKRMKRFELVKEC